MTREQAGSTVRLQSGSEWVYAFRSQEDAATPPDEAVCAAAPFSPTVKLGAGLYVPVADGGHERVGSATACFRLTDWAFTPGTQVPFYARFLLPVGAFTASGECVLVSNDQPQAGVVLAGGTLKLVEVPPGFAGGVLSNLSVFNPLKLPGFATGSYYTLYTFRKEGTGTPSP
ncbi:hypothetical protein [Corallococcus carmarthensis]|uniref:Uncharacterized protein n=1 Tax=Corallococcus carmarthensis TaxID=2316728 RepID=A0A3A8K6E1_9BACT|nr:hypothetical protein [Corallococcus carmarthensis]NOK22872.1 hypothetical protein [Corallococcus carmarthensis]RKH03748.1 hypothetical protein D7X32_13265 [Corallococcus carmarthensis]